ncbi:MAG: zinc ribbon domain-containing protein [Brevefilum sp.]|nr:zinc ribbon domain-containing protein [Brevefilum sp.]
MDFLLYFLILVIVLATGYVLSKPLIKPPDGQDAIDAEINQEKYEKTLREINHIEHDCEAGKIPKEVCQAQISAKKRQAADLLRSINPRLDAVVNDEPAAYSAENDADQPTEQAVQRDTEICPQCGHKVMTSDKFCMHCGHRLQP